MLFGLAAPAAATAWRNAAQAWVCTSVRAWGALLPQVTDVVGQECLTLMERLRGSLLGEGHSWVGSLPAAEPEAEGEHAALGSAPAAGPPAGVEGAALGGSSSSPAGDVEGRILAIARSYIPDADVDQPLAAQVCACAPSLMPTAPQLSWLAAHGGRASAPGRS